MRQRPCPRCCKHTTGVHTCTPTPLVRDLEQEVKRLHADKARLDWLADPHNHIGNVQLPEQCVIANPHSMRAAIDAAMAMDDEASA